ncbi:MAG TPA: alkaline phosphatase [Tenuifilaceae bacterium]|nr:alkaline phosphatase [Tenuifilaceae bacterium]
MKNKKNNWFVIIFILTSVFLTGCTSSIENEIHAKYVFYFIGDGMGIQQVNATEAFLAAKDSCIGNKHLSFTSFPVTGFATTFSATRYITGSAAAGTALATGHKTSINTISMSPDRQDTMYSIAYFANKNGFETGVVTSVSIDHATPSAFYAHQPLRDMYHHISHDLIKSGYRFFGGGGFIDPVGKRVENPLGNVFEKGAEMGVFFTQNLEIPDSILLGDNTIVYSAPNPATGSSLQYHIDRNDTDVSLSDITKLALSVLDNPEGFFLMVEGGKIDWSCHNNDAITTLFETMSFSDAVGVAYEFYKKHPNETLIVVTADHETGGMSLGSRSRGYDSDISFLCNQKESYDAFNEKVSQFKVKYNGKPSFNQFLDFLKDEIGFGNEGMELSNGYLSILKQAFEASQGQLSSTQIDIVNDEYGDYDPLTMAAIKVLNQKAGIGWTSYSHTGSQVPVYAIGVGEELFVGQMDNTDIPKRIAKVMGMEGVLD